MAGICLFNRLREILNQEHRARNWFATKSVDCANPNLQIAIKVSLINRCGYQSRIIGYPAAVHRANAFQKLIYVGVHFKSARDGTLRNGWIYH